MQHGAAVELLSKSPLFYGLNMGLLSHIVQRCEFRTFGAGQVLSVAETPAESAVLIIDGEIALHDADGKSIGETRSRGALLDEAAMFVPTDHLYGAVALGSGSVLELPRYAMGRLLVEQPYLTQHFAYSTRQNLTRMADTLRELDQMLAQPADELEGQPENDAVLEDAEENSSASNGDLPANMSPFGPRDALGGLVTRAHEDVSRDTDAPAGTTQKATDLIAQLNAAISPAGQNPQEQGHDQTVYPNRVLHQSREERPQTNLALDLPKHDQDAGHDSTDASLEHDSSTT